MQQTSANDTRISARIREAREYLELSIEELADMLSIEALELSEIEAGDKSISAAFLPEIAKILGRSLDYFTGEVPAQTASERTEFLARAAESLSAQDIGELQRFATYLQTRSKGAAA